MGSEARPGIDQKLELQESTQIGMVISSTQGTPELVGVGKVNLNSEDKRLLVWKVEPEVGLEAGTHMGWFLSGRGSGKTSKGAGN